MKKMVSMLLALCLVMSLLPMMAVPARAATGGESALQQVFYYDPEAGKIVGDLTYGTIVTMSGMNILLTDLSPREEEGLYVGHSTADGKAYMSQYATEMGGVYVYVANESLREEAGFTEAGIVTQGETVYLVTGDDLMEGTATELKNGLLTIDGIDGSANIPLPLLNSKKEVCAVMLKENYISLITGESDFYGSGAAQPPSTQPPETQPPETQPPETQPPETQPPATEPPATQPPATQPPVTQPPASGPDTQMELAVDLPELEDLYKDAFVQQKSSSTGILVIAGLAAAAVVLVVAVVMTQRKNRQKAKENLNEAEEGTQLADEPAVDTGLRLQLRSGKRIAVRRSLTIGRAPDCTVVVPSTASSVSGHHCEVLVQNGSVCLRDLGSTNGTFINGRRIPVGQPVMLQAGMKVTLGSGANAETFDVVLSSRKM